MNSEISECLEGEHMYEWGESYQSDPGPNILGDIVQCWGSDGVCQVCGVTSWRRVEKYKPFYEPDSL